MSYCPKCRYEYRPGINRCPDCDVTLVDELQEDKTEHPIETVCVGSYQFEIDAQIAKMKLNDCGVQPYLTNEIMSVTSGIDVTAADGGIKLFVRAEDANKAISVLAISSNS